MKVIKIDIPIYFGYLRVVITDNFKKSADKLKVDDEGLELNSYGAFVCSSKDDRGISYFNVFFHEDVDHDLIAHEVVHLVNAIYAERHIKLDIHNDEPQAYLTGWITGEIYKALKR